MSAVGGPAPDPSIIGTIAKPPFAQLPDPARVLKKRMERLRGLAPGHELDAYLRFLAGLTSVQLRIQADLPPAVMPDADLIARAREHAMPPLDRNGFKPDAAFDATLERLLSASQALEMPTQAREALERVRATDDEARDIVIRNVLADAIPIETLAEHIFVAAALQVHFMRLAQQLDKDKLVAVGDGVCPCCGAPPVATAVVGWPGAVGTRFCACSLCGTLWNYVRARCAVCGSTAKITFHEIDGSDGHIKSESCDACHSYIKVLYQQADPALDPVADDVASLGLDMLVREAGYRRGAVNPFLLGY